jgi:acetyl-CoA C-acetyltransferase
MSSLQPQTIRFGSSAGEVDEVILGQVLTANQGQNPARQAAIKAGIPQDKTAFGLNQVCGSGLRAVILGMEQIANGDAKTVVTGGQESMSLSQHGARLRAGTKMGDLKFVDTMLRDGLMDVFNGYHMGQTAENIAAIRMRNVWPGCSCCWRTLARTRNRSRSSRKSARRPLRI